MIWVLNVVQLIGFALSMWLGWFFFNALFDEELPRGWRLLYATVGSTLAVVGFIGILLYGSHIFDMP